MGFFNPLISIKKQTIDNESHFQDNFDIIFLLTLNKQGFIKLIRRLTEVQLWLTLLMTAAQTAAYAKTSAQ
jgi:hypothetical protein